MNVPPNRTVKENPHMAAMTSWKTDLVDKDTAEFSRESFKEKILRQLEENAVRFLVRDFLESFFKGIQRELCLHQFS